MNEAAKKGKKKWYTILASGQFKNCAIGEVPCYTPDSLIGKTLWVNLAHVSGDLKDHSIKVRFKIKSITGDKAETDIIGYELLNAYIKRIVRPARDRIDDSFIAVSKDNVNVRLKTLFLTRAKVKKSIARAIMLNGREELKNALSKNNFDDFVYEVISNRLQRGAKGILSKIYPLSSVDIKAVVRN